MNKPFATRHDLFALAFVTAYFLWVFFYAWGALVVVLALLALLGISPPLSLMEHL